MLYKMRTSGCNVDVTYYQTDFDTFAITLLYSLVCTLFLSSFGFLPAAVRMNWVWWFVCSTIASHCLVLVRPQTAWMTKCLLDSAERVVWRVFVWREEKETKMRTYPASHHGLSPAVVQFTTAESRYLRSDDGFSCGMSTTAET